MRKPLFPFVSSEVETPKDRARLHGISTSLDANGFARSHGAMCWKPQ
ncbi:MAG: hypothetical protein IE934_14735 [Sphingopyxis sp.]|nr:hypothetical protein [Sphingopyxis sp.]